MLLETPNFQYLSIPSICAQRTVISPSYRLKLVAMATTTIKDIALEGPEHYHSWFSNIKGSVPEDLWRYFDPETADEYIEPQAVTFATVRPEATTLQQLSATERTLYTQLRTLHNNEVSHYHRYLTEKSKLKSKLLNTVPEQKRVLLPVDESVRQWISNLRLATRPSDVHMKDVIKSKHRSMMTAKFVDWTRKMALGMA